MGMLKEITINRLVLAKLFANEKRLYKGCVLRAQCGVGAKEKTWNLMASVLKLDLKT